MKKLILICAISLGAGVWHANVSAKVCYLPRGGIVIIDPIVEGQDVPCPLPTSPTPVEPTRKDVQATVTELPKTGAN